MRQAKAFKFIPELIGDFARTMELSSNPKLLYVEAAISTLHMAADVFQTIEELINTKHKKETEQAILDIYRGLEKKRTENYVQEAARQIDIAYECVRVKVHNGQFRDKEVRNFISCLKEELYKVIEIFSEMQMKPDFPNRGKVEEVTRKTLRDYNKLLKIFIEEEENDGQTESE